MLLNQIICQISRLKQLKCNIAVRLISSLKMSTKKALLIVADEAEEMEVVISASVLRRAGVSVNYLYYFSIYYLSYYREGIY